MKDKNLPNDYNSLSLEELTTEANKMIEELEKQKDLRNSLEKYQNLVKLNNLIEKKFQSTTIRRHFAGGNYFLIWPNKNPQILTREMRERGILIREMKNKKDIEDSIRVSIGTQEQMSFFWNIYKELDLDD